MDTLHDPDLHLFVDDGEIHHYRDLLRVLNRPRRRPQPVLIGTEPWEGGQGARVQAWGSVIREPDGRFRIWYMGFGTIAGVCYCYAESDDGIHWQKPSLGVEQWRDSSDNNLFFGFGGDDMWQRGNAGTGLAARDLEGNRLGLLTNMDGMTVLRDDNDPHPQRRYKLFGNMQDHRMFAGFYREEYPDVTEEQITAARQTMGNYLMTSPDGIHWDRDPRRLVRSRHGDYMMVMWDERNRRWWMNERPPGLGGRNAGLRYSDNLAQWTDPPQPVFVNGPESGFGRMWEWHNGITPFNCGSIDLGFLEYWHNAGTGDYCELVCHRDGGGWQRVEPGRPFLDVGAEGAWDRCLVYPTHNPPIPVGDELFIYYTGAGPGTWPAQDYSAAIGLMTIGLHRFAGLANTREAPGVVMTKPVVVSGTELQINVEPGIRAVGVRAAVKRPDWSAIEGFGLEDCQIVIGDGVRQVVRWNERRDLSALRGESVVLEFEVAGMTIYGFRLGAAA